MWERLSLREEPERLVGSPPAGEAQAPGVEAETTGAKVRASSLIPHARRKWSFREARGDIVAT